MQGNGAAKGVIFFRGVEIVDFCTKGNIFLSVKDSDKRDVVYIAKRLEDLGFNLIATGGTAKLLERNGIKRVAPSGLPFDHNLHQAIAQTETREHAPGTVMQVVQAGYTLHGRILRPALVVVAKAPAEDPPPGGTVDKTV